MSLLEAGGPTMSANAVVWEDVPVEHTHKRDYSAVLLQQAADIDEDITRYSLSTPLSSAHYRSSGLDSMLVAEWTRQVVTAVAHRRFEVPLTWAFVMRQMRVEILQDVRPVDAVAIVTTSSLVHRSGRLRTLDAGVDFVVDGRTVARGFGDLQVLEPGVYGRVRAGAVISDALPPRADGVGAVEVIERGPGSWSIVYDPHDRFYFDHPLDHVPGMVFYAALRTIARLASGGAATDLTAFSGEFHRYAELRDPLDVRLRECVRDGRHVRVVVDVINARGDQLVTATMLVAEVFTPTRDAP